MTEPTRATQGGLEERFIVERADGKPIDPSRRYIVLDVSGADQTALDAIGFYAQNTPNKQLGQDIIDALHGKREFPKQHKY